MTTYTASNGRPDSNQVSATVVDVTSSKSSQNETVDEQGERHSKTSSERGRSRESSRSRTFLVNRVDSWNPAPGARPGVVFEDLDADRHYRRHSPSRSRSHTPVRYTGSRSPSPSRWRGRRLHSRSPSGKLFDSSQHVVIRERERSRSRSPRPFPSHQPIIVPPTPTLVPITVPGPNDSIRYNTINTIAQLDNVFGDFSALVIIATFLASVSVAVLSLGRDLCEDVSALSSLNHTLYVILRVFGCLALAFHLSVAIVAGNAASSQSLRARLGQRAREFTSSQHLDIKLSLCSVLRYYGLLSLTISTACLFGLLLDSPYAILMIIPVAGVVFYDALTQARIPIIRPYEP